MDITSTGLWLVEKKSVGQPERGADLEFQTFPMKPRQPRPDTETYNAIKE